MLTGGSGAEQLDGRVRVGVRQGSLLGPIMVRVRVSRSASAAAPPASIVVST